MISLVYGFDTSNALSLFFSLCLVVAAFMTFLAICVQAFIYNAQLKEMKKSTDATTKAAEAAQESVVQAREISRLDQRAWVAATVMTMTGKPEVDKSFTVDVLVRNSGKTFAKKVTIRTHIRAVPKGSEPDFKGENMTPASVALLPPSGEYISATTSDQALSQGSIDQVKSGDTVVFVFGEITYDDIFGCPHWTKFCSVLKPVDWAYTVYKKENDANDNRCP